MVKIEAEYPFTLPQGYIDVQGTLHKAGVMRLASAADEIVPMRDVRVQQNPAYLTTLILARVITQLGSLNTVNEAVIEKLSVQDLAFLNDLYQQINDPREIK